ncbi:hypothetical protein [Acetobacterium woodii]|uniref:Phage-like protein n=1 Tax=Acetobacterium woodii (strain ATCC 29683 / DSM 1030 / JCM 2381 / KCTC 1655 / WB1) TaxID=931626 RepID=H6LCD3_ACEWD|nr:hypothetical protein [Acetobacterium woodii]AFA50248.1 phage-like protein [Acetobacterium woodii DSM 1030]
MIDRSFLEKIEEMAAAELIEVEGVQYSTKDLYQIEPPKPKSIQTKSLTAIVDFIKANIDKLDADKMIIHVIDHQSVQIMSALDFVYRDREYYIRAQAEPPESRLNSFIDRETFNIMLQSRFADVADRAEVLRSIGKMRYENEVKLEDDGITQTVASKSGVALVREEQIPNPVRLAPFRTFSEIEQPISPFILRVDDKCNVGLFEADGGAWKNKAMQSIKDYLEFELGEGYTIIA